MWRPEGNSALVLQESSILLLRYALSLDRSSPSKLGWVGRKPQGPTCLCIPKTRITHICYHAWLHVFVCGGACVWGEWWMTEVGVGCPGSLSTIFLETGFLHWAWDHWFSWTGWPVSSGEPPVSAPTTLGLWTCIVALGFYMDAKDSNLGPHAFVVSILFTRWSLQAPHFFKKKNVDWVPHT